MENLIDIRQLETSDIEEIVQLQLTNNLDWWKPRDYEKEIEREDTLSYVAKSKETTAGFIVSRLIIYENHHNYKLKIDSQNKVKQLRTEIETEIEIEIYNIAVEKSFQKQGIGTTLIEKVIQKSLESNPSLIFVWLEVRASNSSAISFYLKNGFGKAYQRKNFYKHPPEDAIVMKKTVTNNGENFIKLENLQT